MAIEISEKLQANAPIEVVWEFVMDPARVVSCMPGAELLEELSDTTFVGQVKVKLGAITAKYKGEVMYASVDEETYSVQLTGQGREAGGGTAKGSVEIRLQALEDGRTEMITEAKVDLTGKVMQMGGRMIKGVSAQLFKQFAKSAQQQLEAAAAQSGGGASETADTMADDMLPQAAPQEGEALAVVPLLLKTLWAGILNFFRKLFGRPTS
jgi:carbon monoxide dehydrogenase subunit G